MRANVAGATGSAADRLEAGPARALAVAALALARRFATGGTLWCVAPEWSEHGRHVAVEFVHPVVMGARALPAVSVAGSDPVSLLRAVARPGDVALVVSDAGAAIGRDVIRRAKAWGLTTVWIGCGAAPPPGLADHQLWIDDAAQTRARHDGRLVLRYHVLWELTHICFEHPELLVEPDIWDDPACITCADEGRPAEVIAPLGAGLATARTARGLETVDVTLVGEVVAGDLMLVHAGTAIERLDDDGA